MKKTSNSIDDYKEVYGLWYEYLRRSEDYKKFCEWMREKRKNKTLPVPSKFKNNADGGVCKEVANFLLFHDVHHYTFEEWWDYKCSNYREQLPKREEWRIAGGFPNSLELYVSWIEKDMDHCIESFKRYEGREPSLGEFKAYFKQLVEQWQPTHMLIMVDVSAPTQKLTRQFVKAVRESRTRWAIKKTPKELKYFYPNPSTHYFREDLTELKRYLRAYDLYTSNMPLEQVARTILLEDNKNNKTLTPDKIDKALKDPVSGKNIKDDFRKHIAKAKLIIKNVEHGIFPGVYDTTHQKGTKKK